MRILAILFLAGCLNGQRILYNKGLDDKGKATDTAAKKLSSSVTTDQELQNLAVLEKAQIDRIMNGASITMRRYVEGLSTWGSAQTLIDSIQQNIDLVDLASLDSKTIPQQQAAVDAQVKVLNASLAKLKAASKQKPPSLDSAIGLLGQVKDLTDFAGEAGKIKETKDASATIQKVIDGLTEVNALVSSVETIWSTARAMSVDPRTLAPSAEETELAVLAAETQYLKEITLLRAAQQMSYAEVRGILDQLKQRIAAANLDPAHQIRADLATVTSQMNPSADYDTLRRQMLTRVQILYLAASAAAQNTIAADIEGVRETLAWRRYQIRSTAVYNGTYEVAIQAASTRLANYYGAGLKPTQIAQLLHDLAALVSLPKIAF
jgi:hypothetical protein